MEIKKRRTRKSPYDDEFKKKALKDIQVFGTLEAAKRHGVSHTTLYNWAMKMGYAIPEKRPYSESFINHVLTEATSIGVFRASIKNNVHHTTVYEWIRKARAQGYDLKIENTRKPRYYDTEFKKLVADEAVSCGIIKTARRHQISDRTILNWMVGFGHITSPSQRHEDDIKNQIIDFSVKNGVTEAVEKYKIPATTIYSWLNLDEKSGKQLKRGPKTKNAGWIDDISMSIINSFEKDSSSSIVDVAEQIGIGYGSVMNRITILRNLEILNNKYIIDELKLNSENCDKIDKFIIDSLSKNPYEKGVKIAEYLKYENSTIYRRIRRLKNCGIIIKIIEVNRSKIESDE